MISYSMAERGTYKDFPEVSNYLEVQIPTQDQVHLQIKKCVTQEMWEQLSTPIQHPPKIPRLTVPVGVDRSLWLEYLIFMNQRDHKIDSSKFHESYPHPPEIAVYPCHGGKTHPHNHSFQLKLLEWTWRGAVADYDFPSWNASVTKVLTPHYPDGDWMDNLVIGNREHVLRRKHYSHAICNQCYDHTIQQRRDRKSA